MMPIIVMNPCIRNNKIVKGLMTRCFKQPTVTRMNEQTLLAQDMSMGIVSVGQLKKVSHPSGGKYVSTTMKSKAKNSVNPEAISA